MRRPRRLVQRAPGETGRSEKPPWRGLDAESLADPCARRSPTACIPYRLYPIPPVSHQTPPAAAVRAGGGAALHSLARRPETGVGSATGDDRGLGPEGRTAPSES